MLRDEGLSITNTSYRAVQRAEFPTRHVNAPRMVQINNWADMGNMVTSVDVCKRKVKLNDADFIRWKK